MTDPARDDIVSVDDQSTDAASGGDDLDREVTDAELVDTAPEDAEYSPAAKEIADLLAVLELITLERDDHLDTARRVQADFENYKRRIEGQRIEQVQRAAEALVVEILPVLDACDAALAHGADDVLPIQSALFNTLEKRGLTKVDDIGVPFDPVVHEAVLTEPGDANDAEPTVVEIMRSGYEWNGRVVRPAMVKVRG